MSADAVQRLVAKHAAAAARSCPSISSKHVTPHTLRHTAAMALLHAGVDTSVIALWLGHQSPVTTHIYLHADMTIKERALARVPSRTAPPAATGPLTTSSTSSKDYEDQAHRGGYAARATPAKPAEQHEHHHSHHDLGITGTSA